MNIRDAWGIATAVIASLGGGGAIVFGMSGFLGKRWADRALEQDRHRFAKLALEFQSQLNSLGLVHELRTKEEFNKLAGLWKQIAMLRGYFSALPHSGFTLSLSDKQKERERQDDIRMGFSKSLSGAQQYLAEEALFIPKAIADVAEGLLTIANREIFNIVGLHDLAEHSPEVYQQYIKTREKNQEDFLEGTVRLETMMRQHIQGQAKGG